MSLDEFPLFRSDVIDALRQPLESGDITVARQEESVTLPARGLLVFACNPCPCGNYSARPGTDKCVCDERPRRDYRRKISGPIADRIDITRHVVTSHGTASDLGRAAEPSAAVRQRVAAARDRQNARFAGRGWRLNSQVPSARLKDEWPVSPAGRREAERVAYAGKLSARGLVRVLRLAWTLADLRSVRTGEDLTPDVEEVRTALRLRAGDPLDLRMIGSDAGEEDARWAQ